MSLKPTLRLLFKQRCNNSRDGCRRLARPPYRAWVSGRGAVVIPPEVRGEVTADDFSLKLQNQHRITAVWAECSWHYSSEEVVGLFWSRKLIKQLKFHVQPELFWVCSQKRRVTLKKKKGKHFVFTLNSQDKEPMFICIPRIRKPFFFLFSRYLGTSFKQYKMFLSKPQLQKFWT